MNYIRLSLTTDSKVFSVYRDSDSHVAVIPKGNKVNLWICLYFIWNPIAICHAFPVSYLISWYRLYFLVPTADNQISILWR